MSNHLIQDKETFLVVVIPILALGIWAMMQ